MNAKAYLETRILSADPVELINIFYEYAILYVEEARDRLAQKDIAGRAKAISKTLALLNELEVSLDHSAGGQFSKNLAKLYVYMRERLLTANAKQQDAPLAEVEALLKTLGEGWRAIAPGRQSNVEPSEAMSSVPWSGPFSTDNMNGYGAHSWSA
jgi:flagellar protein FliS